MSEITIATWNSQNAFNSQDRYHRAIDEVLAQDADIVGVSEFSKGIEDDRLAEYLELFATEGYQVRIEPYFDKNQPTPFGHHRQEMMAMVRGEGSVASFEAGNRIAMHASTESIEAILVHHEDVSEAERLIGATAVLDYLNHLEVDEDSEQKMKFVGGDFNAADIDDKSVLVQVLRLGRPGTELARQLLGDRFQYYEKPDLERYGKIISIIGAAAVRFTSLSIRLAGMSEGATIEKYKEACFEQLDPDFISTIGLSEGGRKIVKIDHALLNDPSGSAEVKYSVESSDLSDHGIIKTTIKR